MKKKKQNQSRIVFFLLLPQLLLTGLLLLGLVSALMQSLGVMPALGLTKPTLQYYRDALAKPELYAALRLSFRTAFISAVLASVLGTVLCGILAATNKNQAAWLHIAELPIIVPHVTAALLMVNVFSQNGMLARFFYALGLIETQQQFPMLLYDPQGAGVILGYLWKEVPFILYFVYALMSNISKSLGEAARNLGAGSVRTFFSITLPLCKNTVMSGFLIIFVFSFGAYELPALLGATLPKALPVLAYQAYIHPDLHNRPYAMAINGIIILISLLFAMLYFLLMEKSMHAAGEAKKSN